MLSKMKTCEDYRAALSESAASGATASGLPNELHRHIDACTSCRAAFSEELQLFAAIDSGLRAAANVETPLSLLPRVRAQINEQHVPRHSWVPASAALAAAAALVFAMVLVRSKKGEAVKSIAEISSVATGVAPAEVPAAPPIRAMEKTSPPIRSHSLMPKPTRPNPAVEQVSVLLPAGHKEAVDALLAGLRRGPVAADDLPAEKTAQPLQDLSVSPLSVAPLEMKPLEDVSGNPAPEIEQTKD